MNRSYKWITFFTLMAVWNISVGLQWNTGLDKFSLVVGCLCLFPIVVEILSPTKEGD